jgi:flotillin
MTTSLLAASLRDFPGGEQAAQVGILALGFTIGIWAIIFAYRRFLFICRPNELLVVSGKKTTLASGEVLNFEVIQAGRHFQLPFIQTVDRMDVRLIPIELSVTKVLSNGGIPLDVHAIANVKITSDTRYVHNAVERFLNVPPDTVRTSAKQILEGVLRGVIAQLTPEQVNQDRIEFANQLLEMTTDDFNKMGLHLDTLKVQRVEDEAQYLVNLGRTQIANAIRDAENAESQANQEVAQEEAGARQLAEVAGKQAEIGVATKRNQYRAIRGQLEGDAQSVEREAIAAVDQTRAEAEQELQKLRKDVETSRLTVEVVLPAEANRAAAELTAQGQAAGRREQGAASAFAMAAMSQALQNAGSNAREMFVLSQLDTLVAEVAAKVKDVSLNRVHLVDSGDGKALAALLSSGPHAVTAVLASLRDLSGVDITELLAAQAPPPTKPTSAGGVR